MKHKAQSKPLIQQNPTPTYHSHGATENKHTNTRWANQFHPSNFLCERAQHSLAKTLLHQSNVSNGIRKLTKKEKVKEQTFGKKQEKGQAEPPGTLQQRPNDVPGRRSAREPKLLDPSIPLTSAGAGASGWTWDSREPHSCRVASDRWSLLSAWSNRRAALSGWRVCRFLVSCPCFPHGNLAKHLAGGLHASLCEFNVHFERRECRVWFERESNDVSKEKTVNLGKKTKRRSSKFRRKISKEKTVN